jgi:hypothetical protein
MKQQYIFPTMLILLQAFSGIVSGAVGDWRKAIYWIAAAILNITVTF